ncbi:DNA methyltransferase [Micromonospora globispora]|uniref:DNA methyltransferase n=2 Tax=Micromonospora globispora TaxID=1450148 RepID=A0A317K6W0_9ACTN|nr:DNA methyltransferase [Micromonospora globispora]
MIPLEAARLGVPAHAIDYSPVAVLASQLLTDYPFRDWSSEPTLPADWAPEIKAGGPYRLVDDLEKVLAEIGRRYSASMAEFYPPTIASGNSTSVLPWGYLWAVSLPCQECGNRFPLVGSYELRKPSVRRATKARPEFRDPGQSYYIEVDRDQGSFYVVVHAGPPKRSPTLTNAIDATGEKIAGKTAVCIFCSHPHPLPVHRRLADEGKGQDVLLIVADHDPRVGKSYRTPTDMELEAASRASVALRSEPAFNPMLPAVPSEKIAPGNNNIIGPSIYGARTFGDMMCGRQTLAFVRLSRIIDGLGRELEATHGLSRQYARALTGFAAAQVARKVRRATRGCTLDVARNGVHDIYLNEGSLSFSYDYFESGIGTGPGTWDSLAASGLTTLRSVMQGLRGVQASVEHGSADSLTLPSGQTTAVVTDPPYDQMIAYADASDIAFVWIKRALSSLYPEMQFATDETGAQNKAKEAIVKRVRGEAPNEHRTPEHYDALIAAAFREAKRVVRHEGVVTIVFGHGEPDVWQRLLAAIAQADLIMTGSWPANTEAGGGQGKANIKTTLTMACRPAPAGRQAGRRGQVEAEIRQEIAARYPQWVEWGLAPTDMLMAAAGPAMEVVGRYSVINDNRGRPVDIATFLPLARAAVQEVMAVTVDQHRLDDFDPRTRFALWWVRLFGRRLTAKSELRWQVLASSLELAEVRDLVPTAEGGCRLITADAFKGRITPESSTVDVCMAMARAHAVGLDEVAAVLSASGRAPDDLFLWSAVTYLADRLPGADKDVIAWQSLLRNRAGVETLLARATQEQAAERRSANLQDQQEKLF